MWLTCYSFLVTIATLFFPWITAKLSNYVTSYDHINQLNSMGDATRYCLSIPGLTRSQLKLCYQQPDAVSVAIEGLQLAVKECQHQFQGHRWNCSSLINNNNNNERNPLTSNILKRGFKETAFVNAISSAGVVINIARACSQGRLLNCGCDPQRFRNTNYDDNNGKVTATMPTTKGTTSSYKNWKWGSCSYNLQYGIKFSRRFLDAKEKDPDIHTKINTHNNQVGRMMVSSNMSVKCKCHGMSGSCELKTCWRVTPTVRKVGKLLKERYKKAVLVEQTNLGNGNNNSNKNRNNAIATTQQNDNKQNKLQNRRSRQNQWTPVRNKRKKKKKKDLTNELLFYQRSPNYCEKDATLSLYGTYGRQCNHTIYVGTDSCSLLCCGRGYNLIRSVKKKKCNCKFLWCCTVECQTCIIEEWISVCK